ncbi:MAG: Glu-tRNA(Gln) amidotransferase subunit GatE [Candidatus ainarchaeum sp.]|nr:Glu-tRNA(Gln) amidotransferase subunit GatE [Candidatus ainarchaeum sp.]
MELDFEKLGLKSGLEIHQQLDTGKLFCRCPSILREDKPDKIFHRYIRAVASELGEFDAAALEAAKKGTVCVYEAYSGTNCLVETDDEPVKPADKQALETVLKIALMANSKIIDEIITMRKAIADGSAISGFQRTALVAVGGSLELSNKTVGVQSIALEEDAARPMEKTEGKIVYRLDRLGIPLIEFATMPDLKSPEEVKECALKIGELLRRTCAVKRGLGTIRQDLNVSIAEGARVEIKGVQELEIIDEYVRREALRQSNLVRLKKELLEKGISEKNFSGQAVDLNGIFSNSECKFLKGKNVFGLRLEKCKGLLGRETQPGKRFGSELAAYVKAKTGLQGIIHSDELPNYGISEEEILKVREKLDCSEEDAFAFVSGQEEKAFAAIEIIKQRFSQALIGVPEETRNPLEGGNSEYSRPLPGAARMYPETDLAPIKTLQEELKKIEKSIPLTVEQRLALYKKHGLGEKLANEMKLNNYACFFEELLKRGFNATISATLLLENFTEMKRAGIPVENITDRMVIEILEAIRSGAITKEVLLSVAAEWAKNPEKSLSLIMQKFSIERASNEQVRQAIRKIIEKNSALVREKKLGAASALMGDIMKELKGKANGALINRVLQEELEKFS